MAWLTVQYRPNKFGREGVILNRNWDSALARRASADGFPELPHNYFSWFMQHIYKRGLSGVARMPEIDTEHIRNTTCSRTHTWI